MPFTKEELAAIAAADAEIERDFCMDLEERRAAHERDDEADSRKRPGRDAKQREYSRQYKARNKAELARKKQAARAAWSPEKREQELAKQRERYRRNREERLAYQRAYDAAHKDQITARKKAKKEREKKQAEGMQVTKSGSSWTLSGMREIGK